MSKGLVKKRGGNCGVEQHISSICVHKGEEPVISDKKSVCNIFFSHCNMQCSYCQNYEISNNKNPIEKILTTNQVVEKVIYHLNQGVNKVGFVSPSHMLAQVIDIIETLKQKGYSPVFIWNSNGYDKAETIKMLENYI
ncbi:MAG: 4Fe-4S cluster-binding domain-containing protein [Bacteroidales bacterium]|nr:4Fe-4S cluster-binding domain-containing protein [Bacteroidales bacterium]